MCRTAIPLLGLVVTLLLASCTRGPCAAAPDALGLRQIAEFPLPGGTTRWDYQSRDATTGRLSWLPSSSMPSCWGTGGSGRPAVVVVQPA